MSRTNDGRGGVVGTHCTDLRMDTVTEGSTETCHMFDRTRSPRQSVASFGISVGARRGLVPPMTANSSAGTGCVQAGSNPAPAHSLVSHYDAEWAKRGYRRSP